MGIPKLNALECSADQWSCKSGQCINIVQVCDGVKHCSDGSDETFENCQELSCPDYAFRCAYGGCVRGTSRCDNVTDCVDGSDEALCGLTTQALINLVRGNCSSELEFECLHDECINSIFLCDGEIHCSNDADEKPEICSQVYCPEYAFRCAYGACVSGKAKCDGKIDCADGSDENSSLCSKTKVINNTYTYDYIPIHAKPKLNTCIVPTNNENLIVKHGDTKEIIKLGHGVVSGTVVQLSCIDKYIFRGTLQNFCLPNGKWLFDLPVCKRSCSVSNILNDPSITAVDCSSNKAISYFPRLDVGTKICLGCAPGYFWNVQNYRNQILTCTANGNWDFQKFSCEPECGVLRRKNILNNTIPWVVSIYMRNYMPQYHYICTGTIISAKLVLTANTCITDDRAVLYNIVEGDYRQAYKSGGPTGRIAHNVSEIVKPNNIDDGIALMVLINYFTYSVDVKPICLFSPSEEPFKEYNYKTDEDVERIIRNLASGSAISEQSQTETGQMNLLAIVGDENMKNKNVLLNVNIYKTFINTMLRRYEIVS
ncbi:modular serine protease-like [Teleopsis dalmanni]|uniref:modular serine protease-like n=1 Tax=Teleopsis dalmanni TaxID=139649 RepID=UPI0018CF9F26|nr:modular serine protease-like [Teleopsis dalmanni]